ncbi:MAG: aminotransferase class III-fold pyridoxal phosphate-dependent enzyme [Fuerstiella sp.]|nr:aminotransferase class III-fold pyridoxal phosphate-dependent enzyme [Fuerstiella sp.]MCP4855666.1 aminotransferase class III-fold pyridoxal phosphate-dependent enzyme [Fuerstiella sp.]
MIDFDWVQHSPFPDPQWADFQFQSLRAMFVTSEGDPVATKPVLVGVVDGQETVVTIADFQTAIQAADRWRVEQQLAESSRVVIVRLPYASELVVAVNALALMAAGISVVLPMEGATGSMEDLIERTESRCLLAPIEQLTLQRHPPAAAAAGTIESLRCRLHLPDCSLPVAFPLSRDPAGGRLFNDRPQDRSVDPVSREVLVLTTSATSGPAKLVRYSERALLTVAESWRKSGLLQDATTGGPSICPLLSHSMGMRNVLHAIWTRQPTVLVPPEWVSETPHRVLRLLRSWPPRHLTAGPALINSLAQLTRMVPEARKALRSLEVVVSSGSVWNPGTTTAFANARAANAFGMTETQQVLSTLVPAIGKQPHLFAAESDFTKAETDSVQPLGTPLPGVSAAVRFIKKDSPIGHLFIRSTFKANGYVGQADFPEWFDTGDTVRVVGDKLEYIGRGDLDFINLGSGLKVAISDLQLRYQTLYEHIDDITYRQSAGRSGVVALAYCGTQDPTSSELHKRVCEHVSSLHERLALETHEFQSRHASLVAIGFVSGAPPTSGPGKLNHRMVADQNRALIEALDDPDGHHPQLTEIEPRVFGDEAWYQHVAPSVGQLMQALKLDVEYTGGSGDRLFVDVGGEQRKILDFVGGFGSNLLGHGRSDLQNVAIKALSEVPLLDQGSRRSAASCLADTLSNRFGRETGRRYICLLSSTGAEAVETALKHALFKWQASCDKFNAEIRAEFGAEFPAAVRESCDYNLSQYASFRPLLIALQGGFHGKTTGALNAMADDSQRNPFTGLLGARVRFMQRAQLADPQPVLESLCSQEVLWLRRPDRSRPAQQVTAVPVSGIMAAIAEPIQGEGGIFEVPKEFFTAVQGCNIPLIADEIQCGLGRSGQFLASSGATPDYCLVGKSLGGGIAKISATLIDRTIYCDQFDLQTGATFSSDRLSSSVASRVLELIDSDDIAGRAVRIGEILKEHLESLRQQFPTVLGSISGRGVMLGIELILPEQSNRFLKTLAEKRLGYFAASFLLNCHGIRVLPTLSAPCVLRLEPSVYLQTADVECLIHALQDFCQRLARNDVAGLLRHLSQDARLTSAHTTQAVRESHRDTAPSTDLSTRQVRPKARRFTFQHEQPAEKANRVGFIFNPIYPADELLVEIPELLQLSMDQRLDLVWRLQTLMEFGPMELFSRNLFAGRVWMCGILLPVAPQVLSHLHRTGNLDLVRKRLDDALTLATERGCQTVVFGAQTSIVTLNATTVVPPPGVQVSSGNSFTVATVLAAIERERHVRKIPSHACMGIVGATGNIGSAILRWYAHQNRWSGSITLLGRPGSEQRLKSLRNRVASTTTAKSISVSRERTDLRHCDVIIVAVGGNGVVVEGQHLRRDANVLVADVSQPRGTSPTLERERPNAKVIQAGWARLPQDPSFRLTPHSPAGTCFACAAEAILMGLEPHALKLCGSIDPEAIEVLQALGEKHEMIAAPPSRN